MSRDELHPIEVRWSERPRGGTGPEDRAAALLRQLRPPAPLSREALARIEARLAEAAARPSWPGRLLWAPALAGAVAVLLLLAHGRRPDPPPSSGAHPSGSDEVSLPEGATARLPDPGGAHLLLAGPAEATIRKDIPVHLRHGRLTVRAAGTPVRVALDGGQVAVRPGALVEIAVAERQGVRVAAYVGTAIIEWHDGSTTQVEEGSAYGGQALAPLAPAGRIDPKPDLQPAVAAPRDPRRRSAAQPAAEGPSPEPAVGLAAETRLIGQALQELRNGRAEEALRLLDEHRMQFANGELLEEARAARIEALLRLGRRRAALTELESLSMEQLSRTAELRVLRGELRAEQGRCDDAISDFTAVLQARPPATAEERAWYGRASCRSQRGDIEGARADLLDYLRRFPGGRFSDAAREALGK
ncbi:MAG: tetratricopeptide repeat protein [Myxococcales bacterium]|nr:tetratricopeptide repeat protein [Myxococcales bacterium]